MKLKPPDLLNVFYAYVGLLVLQIMSILDPAIFSTLLKLTIAVVLATVYDNLFDTPNLLKPERLRGEFVQVADIGHIDLMNVNELIIRSNTIEITVEEE